MAKFSFKIIEKDFKNICMSKIIKNFFIYSCAKIILKTGFGYERATFTNC